MSNIETPYPSGINFLPKGAPGSVVPSLPFPTQFYKEMIQMSCFIRPTSFPLDSFPGFPHLLSHSLTPVAPPPPRIEKKSQGPLPTLHFASTCAAEFLTLLSQLLLSEVTRYFGPDDRGVNGNFHPTQMRSCM